MKISDEKMIGSMGPKFYGFSYYDCCRAEQYWYPIPFNVIVRYWMKFYRWIQHPTSSGLMREEKVYRKGYDEGFERGRNTEKVLHGVGRNVDGIGGYKGANKN